MRLDLRPAELAALDAEILREMETGAERRATLKKEKQQRERKEKRQLARDWRRARKLNRELDRIRAGEPPGPRPPTSKERQARTAAQVRYENKRRKLAHLRTISAKALKPHNKRLAGRMFLCERMGRQYTCVACGSSGIVPVGCNVRGCPACERKKADRDAAKYGESFDGKRARLATFTMRNVPITGDIDEDAGALRAALCELAPAFRQLRHNKQPGTDPARPFDFKACMVGGIWKREVTVKCSPDGVTVWWHVHLHVLFWGRFIPQPELKAAWKALTGCTIVDIREMQNVREIVKYACKAFDYTATHGESRAGKGMTFAQVETVTGKRITAGHLLNLWQRGSRRLRLIQTFGDAYAVPDPEDSDPQCPDCGGFCFEVKKCVIPYDPRGPPLVDLWRGADLYNPPPMIAEQRPAR